VTENQETVIQMRDVTKCFGEVSAVKDITLDVPQGGIFGFIDVRVVDDDNHRAAADRQL
jgi:ABC-type transporter Mla maintaining outer membrane lipid asymmetry ATPase subunit MlaF